MRRGRGTVVLLLAISTALLPPEAQAHVLAEGSFRTAEIALAPYEANPSVVVDGAITPGEYSVYGHWVDADSGFSADFVHDNDSLFVALSNPGPGWVALGFSSDLDKGIGFVMVGLLGGGVLQAVERTSSNFTDNLTFSPPSASGTAAIVAFSASTQGGRLTAEVHLVLASRLWSLQPGVVTPTLLAFNQTAIDFPQGVAGGEVHPLRTYLLRPHDDPDQIRQLFAMQISPVPGLVAVAVTGFGLGAIFLTFVRPRRKP